MLWVTLAVGSALFLGFYDISKKKALTGNAVLPVLFLVSLTCAVLLSPVYFAGMIPEFSLAEHLRLMLKAVIVTTSWVFTFHAVSRLPLSITAPVRASAPIFTIAMAVAFMGERPGLWEWVGIGISLVGYFLMSIASRRETGHFFTNVWILSMFFGTFLGSVSGVYDKFLLQRAHLDPLGVQFFYNIYMAVLQGALILSGRIFSKGNAPRTPFRFRWVILLVGVFLVAADRFYFLAVHEPDALISVVTIIRRSNVLISFLGGLLFFHERRSAFKSLAMAAILLGLFCFAMK
jgi:bacterial/archaeal transporter family protein